MKKYGVVLIGCGHIGDEHIKDIYYRHNINIIAVIDSDLNRAELFQKKYSSKFCDTNYEEYLKRDDVDIVIIATYVNTHLEILKKCVHYNKHVICEKPIVSNEKDGIEFMNIVKNTDSKILISHILRYNKSYLKIKELISSGVIGEIKLMRMAQNHHTIDWERYHKLLQDCSPILDCGVHYFDVMQWFTGSKIMQVAGIGCEIGEISNGEHPNYGMVTVKLANGAVGYYEAGWSKNIASVNIKEFIGQKGRITLTLRQQRQENKEEGDLIEIYLSDTGTYKQINIPCKYKPMYEQVNHLIDLINGKCDDNGFDSVYSAFKVALCADKALKENLTLKVE